MPNKIKSISVDGYKNILDSTSPIHDLTVIVGPNNSGKSNLLEVFNLLGRLFFGSDENRDSIFKEGTSLRGGSIACHLNQCKYKPINIGIKIDSDLFGNEPYEVKYKLSIQCNDIFSQEDGIETGFMSEELTYKEKSKSGIPRTLIKRNRDAIEFRRGDGKFTTKKIELNIPSFKATQVLYPDFQKLDENTKKSFLSLIIAIDSNIIYISPNEIRKALGDGEKKPFSKTRISSFDIIHEIYKIHDKEDVYEEFKNTICSILGFEKIHFDSIVIPKNIVESQKLNDDRINFFRLELPGQPPASVHEFSDGTLMVISIVLGIISPERHNSLLCIEEPENCLHPRALKALINYIKQKSHQTQFIITTHSPYIINLMDPKDILVADVDPNGGTSFNPISNLKELHKRLQGGYFSFGDLLEDLFIFPEGEDF